MITQPAPVDRSPRPAPRRWLRRVLLAVVVLTVLGATYVVVTFVQVVSASRHDGVRPAEAIVVLGAAQYDGRPSPVLQDRLDHALELWQDDIAPTVVVTGGRQPGDRFTEADAGYTYLRERGVPDEAILKEVSGRNTWESLAASARFLRARGIDDVLLITDGYHAFRVEAIARELGLTADVSPSDSNLSFLGEVKAFARETAAVSVGRIIGYQRLVRLDDAVHAP